MNVAFFEVASTHGNPPFAFATDPPDMWRSEYADQCVAPLMTPFGRRLLKRISSVEGKALAYKVDHLQAYQSHSLAWPPEFDDAFKEKVKHLPKRMQELVFFIEKTASPDAGETVHDLNMSMQWLCSSEICPCIVSSSHLWYRQKDNGTDMCPTTALALQGSRPWRN